MNLLLDQLFRIMTSKGIIFVSLPELLEALGTDQIISYAGLRRHQEDAFHIFLCYIAAAILVRRSREDPHQNEEFWRTGLLELSKGSQEAWSLVVDDPLKPAFMQPPVPSMKVLTRYKLKASTPDSLDLLITAKNHDLKIQRSMSATPEDWIYALINLQTMSSFLGRGNYGICRMHSSYGSRPCIALRYSETTGGLFQEESKRLIDLYSQRLSGLWGYRPDGLVLTWLSAWDGKKSLSLSDLHPFFVEACRAVRLKNKESRFEALAMPTDAPRIAAKELNGAVGDPWIPLNTKKDGAALTVPASGFTPALIRNILFRDGYILQEMQEPLGDRLSYPCRFYASVLVGGKCTTDGFHAISLPIPRHVAKRLFGGGADHDRLKKLSEIGLDYSSRVQNRALRPALYSLLEAGPEKLDFGKKQLNDWMEKAVRYFSSRWGDDFFPWLWRTTESLSEEEALNEWRQLLKDNGLSALRDAIVRYPKRIGRRYRASVKAESIYLGSFHNLCLVMNGEMK